MNHYPHHLGDYAKDTLGLTMAEHGAYRLLLDAYYASESPLPSDEVHAIAKAITAADRKAVDRVLRKFDLRDGFYHHKRVEEEIAAYRARSKQGTENIRKRYRNPSKGGNGSVEPVKVLASSQEPNTNNPVKAQYSGVRDIPAPADRVAALTAICSASRIETNPVKASLHLRQWAAEGVTDEQLTDAIALARERLGDNGIVRIVYLAPIVADLRAGRLERIEPRGKDAIAGAIAAIAAREGNATH